MLYHDIAKNLRRIQPFEPGRPTDEFIARKSTIRVLHVKEDVHSILHTPLRFSLANRAPSSLLSPCPDPAQDFFAGIEQVRW